MKTLMVAALLLGLTALAGMFFSRSPLEDGARGQALAVSFGLFRRAAWQFAYDNPEHQGHDDGRPECTMASVTSGAW